MRSHLAALIEQAGDVEKQTIKWDPSRCAEVATLSPTVASSIDQLRDRSTTAISREDVRVVGGPDDPVGQDAIPEQGVLLDRKPMAVGKREGISGAGPGVKHARKLRPMPRQRISVQ